VSRRRRKAARAHVYIPVSIIHIYIYIYVIQQSPSPTHRFSVHHLHTIIHVSAVSDSRPRVIDVRTIVYPFGLPAAHFMPRARDVRTAELFGLRARIMHNILSSPGVFVPSARVVVNLNPENDAQPILLRRVVTHRFGRASLRVAYWLARCRRSENRQVKRRPEVEERPAAFSTSPAVPSRSRPPLECSGQ